jgi:hypothetical protein
MQKMCASHNTTAKRQFVFQQWVGEEEAGRWRYASPAEIVGAWHRSFCFCVQSDRGTLTYAATNIQLFVQYPPTIAQWPGSEDSTEGRKMPGEGNRRVELLVDDQR